MSIWAQHIYFLDLDLRMIEFADDRSLKELLLAQHMVAPTRAMAACDAAFDAAAGEKGYGIIYRYDLRLIVIAAREAYRRWGWDRDRAHDLAFRALEQAGLVFPQSSSFGPKWSRRSLWAFFNDEPYSLPNVIRRYVGELADIDSRMTDALEAVRFASTRLKGLA